MQLVSEMKTLVEKKEMLEKELVENEREHLEWQQKFQQAQEMKENIAKEMSENGDVGAMKNEIHRMEVCKIKIMLSDYYISSLLGTIYVRYLFFITHFFSMIS